MFKTPPNNKATKATKEANGNETREPGFGSMIDLSRTINVGNRPIIERHELPGPSRSIEAPMPLRMSYLDRKSLVQDRRGQFLMLVCHHLCASSGSDRFFR